MLNSPITLIFDRKNGTYIEQREFEDSELRVLIDGVLSSRYIPANYSKNLIEKLCRQSNKYFRPRVKNICSVNDWNKTENVSVFLNIELIDEAIERGKQIRFEYNKYGADKQEYIEMLVDESVLDQVVDWFGKDVKIEEAGGRYKVSLLASPSAMEYWALQYVKSVEVVSPKYLRNRIGKTLENAIAQYK